MIVWPINRLLFIDELYIIHGKRALNHSVRSTYEHPIAFGFRICFRVSQVAEQVSDCHCFWRHFRFPSRIALAQVLCLTITTKSVTLRIRRVVSSTEVCVFVRTQVRLLLAVFRRCCC